MSEQHGKPNPLIINMEYNSEEQKIGAYADISQIAVSPYTFSFEFAQAYPQKNSGGKLPSAKMICRIVMSPGHAKAFYDILGENIKIFETQFCEIKTFEPIRENLDGKK